MKTKLHNPQAWSVTPIPVPTGATRRSGVVPILPDAFLQPGVEIAEAFEAAPAPSRRTLEPLEFESECPPGERLVLVVRQPSGALTFHAPRIVERRSGGAKSGVNVRFRVELPANAEPSRRGLISAAVKYVIVKVKEAVVDKVVGTVVKAGGRIAEGAWWSQRGLQEGWHQVSGTGGALTVRPVRTAEATSGRALLLLHGTFSHASGAFGALASTPGGFFEKLRPIYGDRIFAFNHYTISRTPEENARTLLEALPDRAQQFDVITHSRGGLVLRHLSELGSHFGPLARRFQLGHGILVASPNCGTPLATQSRWQNTFGYFANLLEMFPENPFTTGASFVADGLVWLAKNIIGNSPGLASMDADGETIAALQEAGGPTTGSYSALVANFHPDRALLGRLLDAGMDSFFGGANDLVVPSEGGWLADGAGAAIPGSRIGCFGAGGNLRPDAPALVNHINFFSQPETVQFLLNALGAKPQQITVVDPAGQLPSRKLVRGASATQAIPAAPQAPRPTATRTESSSPTFDPLRAPGRVDGDQAEADDTLHLIILSAASEPSSSAASPAKAPGETAAETESAATHILAMYGNARVLERFPTRNVSTAKSPLPSGPGSRFAKIINTHKGIRLWLEGSRKTGDDGITPSLPDDGGLRTFGELLFDALFVGNVRRLYDVARSQQTSRPLNVVLTCTVPWIASKPWEFSFDPSRRKFLVTEEVHFIRNVLTAVPAQRVVRRDGPLRMLVVVAQPMGTAALNSDDEQERIRFGFEKLITAGLFEVDVLVGATPGMLHDRIHGRALEEASAGRAQYDIVHFIGHGEFDRDAGRGVLAMQNADGGIHRVDIRALREILCGRGIQLVFLNACDTAEDSETALNRGVAQSLVEGGLPAVVANQYKVLDPSAIAFAERFYWSLAHGASLGEAAREARISLNYSIDGEAIDWAIPVLYARDPDFRLIGRLREVIAMPARTARTAPAAGLENRRRIGIADVARYFPNLAATCERMNSVQELFYFTHEEIVAPLGSWQVHKDDETGADISYLYAPDFARKLKDKPAELGVEILACITNRPMCDDDTLGLYGWVSGSPEEGPRNIQIFSTDGLVLPREGAGASRAVVNQIAAGLADFFTENHLSSHEKGAKDCPFYFNNERDIEIIVGRQKFDKTCRAKILKHIEDGEPTLKAIEALLAAFD